MALHSVTGKAYIVNEDRWTGMVTLVSPGAWAEEVAWRGSAELVGGSILKRGAGHGLLQPALLSFYFSITGLGQRVDPEGLVR